MTARLPVAYDVRAGGLDEISNRTPAVHVPREEIPPAIVRRRVSFRRAFRVRADPADGWWWRSSPRRPRNLALGHRDYWWMQLHAGVEILGFLALLVLVGRLLWGLVT